MTPENAAELLKNGEIVAIPTETVYGLAADACNEKAVAKIFKAKGRPADNPLIIHVATREQANELAETNETSLKLMEKFWPGPLTLIMKKRPHVPKITTGGLDTVAIRMPNHPVALDIIKNSRPLAAPSANKSGKPSPTTAEHVKQDIEVPVVDGGSTRIGLESTVVDCTTSPPTLLRPGAITLEQLQEITPTVAGTSHKSPGMRYRHYAPNAQVILTDDVKEALASHPEAGALASKNVVSKHTITWQTKEELAANLYAYLREFDRHVKTIIAEKVNEQGIGKAIMDRLNRAASASSTRSQDGCRQPSQPQQ